MSDLDQETARSAIDLWQEYGDYLERFTATEDSPRPLNLAEFQAVLGRWHRDYHAAWHNNDLSTMRELERLLAL